MARPEYFKNRFTYVKLFSVSNTFSHKIQVATKDADGFGNILSRFLPSLTGPKPTLPPTQGSAISSPLEERKTQDHPCMEK